MSSAKMSSLTSRRTEVAKFTKKAKRNGDRTAYWGMPEKEQKTFDKNPRMEKN